MVSTDLLPENLMRPNTLAAVLAILVTVCLSADVEAGVVDPTNSTVPACMALCPLGDLPFTVVTRDLAHNPLAGVFVTLDFSACPGALLCPARPADPYTVDLSARTLRMNTDLIGIATFPARVGGTGLAGCVRVIANGVILRQYALASPDQDGDGVVTHLFGDEPAFAGKLGTLDLTADFDCDGDVDVDDQVIFRAHFSHGCSGLVIPVRRSSWGTLKAHYR